MEVGGLDGALSIESVLERPIWPSKWPYGPEDFRPWDYTRDEVINTQVQYIYSQSLLESDNVQIIPGLLRIPIARHFILPKDKVSLADHLSVHFKKYARKDSNISPQQRQEEGGARVLELFSCYESILPGMEVGPTVGVGWYGDELECNAALDDYVEQDISVDPYLPLASNYFDFVTMPANVQLLQRPRELFQEINRVLKPGGIAFIGLKLAHWSFLTTKQGRYYAETNYFEDALAVASFFHYSGGFTRPRGFDLTLPEVSPVGKFKDIFFPQPRLDFYAVIQARKSLSSPHGLEIDEGKKEKAKEKENQEALEQKEEGDGAVSVSENPIKGVRYMPRLITNPVTKERRLGPFY